MEPVIRNRETYQGLSPGSPVEFYWQDGNLLKILSNSRERQTDKVSSISVVFCLVLLLLLFLVTEE